MEGCRGALPLHRVSVCFLQQLLGGVLAVADRDETNKNAFTVRYGNEKLNGCSLGGYVCALLAERFIRKTESRYISKETSFERKREDLRKWYIESKLLPF